MLVSHSITILKHTERAPLHAERLFRDRDKLLREAREWKKRRANQSSTFLNQPSRDMGVVIDNQTTSCPSRRTSLPARSVVELKDIGSFLSDTSKILTLATGSLKWMFVMINIPACESAKVGRSISRCEGGHISKRRYAYCNNRPRLYRPTKWSTSKSLCSCPVTLKVSFFSSCVHPRTS